MTIICTSLNRMLIVAFTAFLFACNSEPRQSIVPEHLDEIENLTIFSGNSSPNVDISFEHEISIGDSPEQPIGTMGGFTVDNLGRVYISDHQEKTLHVFEADGTYLSNVGRSGSGPGEYTVGPFPTVKSDQLFVLDPMRLLMNIYTTNNFELIRTINVNPTNKGSFDGLDETHVNQIMIIDEERFLVRMSTFIREFADKAGELKDDKNIYFYLMGDDARLTGPLIVPVTLYEITGRVPEQFQFQGPFARVAPSPQLFTKPLVAASENGEIVAAMSDHILIRRYTSDGDYQSAFYHPFEHLKMNRDDAINAQVTELLADIVSQNDLLEAWPAMDRMLVDDEGRIWISTIVENFDVYEWWILEESGELITKFDWPRDELIVIIKNGKMYTRETDEESGLVQVVRYGIELQ